MIATTTTHQRYVRRMVLAGVVTALLAVLPVPVSACSCMDHQNPRATLAAAAGAFVGVLERIDRESDDGATFHYRIEHAIKGVTGDTVSIFSRGDGASCGLEGSPGKRVGLFLGRKGEEWTSSLCSTIDPERLLGATRPLPPPDGRGAPAYVVGNSLGDHRAMLLDSQGRTLAYGAGRAGSGDVIQLSLCPGARRVVEALSPSPQPDWPILAVRALDGFAVEKHVAISALPGIEGRHAYVSSLRCRGPSADALDLVVHHSGTSVYRLENGAWRVVWTDKEGQAVLAGTTGALVWWPDRIERLDLASGVLAPVHQAPRVAQVSPSPDGRLAAVTTTTPEHRADRLLLVDTVRGELLASQALQATDYVTSPVWVDDRTVATVESRGSLVFRDRSLRLTATVTGWNSHLVLTGGGHVFGIGYDRRIVEATAARPTARPWVQLPDGATFALVAVPPVVPRRSTSTTATTATTTPTTSAPSPLVTEPPPPPLETAAPPTAPASSSRPWAPAAVATLLLIAVAAAARRSVRRSGWPAAHGAVR